MIFLLKTTLNYDFAELFAILKLKADSLDFAYVNNWHSFEVVSGEFVQASFIQRSIEYSKADSHLF